MIAARYNLLYNRGGDATVTKPYGQPVPLAASDGAGEVAATASENQAVPDQPCQIEKTIPSAGGPAGRTAAGCEPEQLADKVRAVLEDAEKLFLESRMNEARRAYLEILAVCPDQPQALNRLGIIAARENQLQDAESFFLRAIEASPSYPAPYSNLGNIRRELGDLEGAIRLYDKALELDPDYAAAYHNKGVVYRQMGRLDKAVPLLKKAARLELRQPRDEGEKRSGWAHLGSNRLVLWIILFVGVILLLSLRK